jgi:hypothetical protein
MRGIVVKLDFVLVNGLLVAVLLWSRPSRSAG